MWRSKRARSACESRTISRTSDISPWCCIAAVAARNAALSRRGRASAIPLVPYRDASRSLLDGKRQTVRDSSERCAPIQATAPIERRGVRTCRLSSSSGWVKSGCRKRMPCHMVQKGIGADVASRTATSVQRRARTQQTSGINTAVEVRAGDVTSIPPSVAQAGESQSHLTPYVSLTQGWGFAALSVSIQSARSKP
jgi:hypothetical protein